MSEGSRRLEQACADHPQTGGWNGADLNGDGRIIEGVTIEDYRGSDDRGIIEGVTSAGEVIERVRSEAAVHETIDRSIGRDCQRERPLD